MKHKVCVVTGTRAEYGLLRRLLFRLRDDPEIQLDLVVTGTHLIESFGNTQKEIVADGFEHFARIPIPMDDDSKAGMACSTGAALSDFAKYFSTHRPELIVVLGDRFEIFAAVAAAHMLGVPVAHICGGDVTEGAVDDAIRHCITKMSVLHFPSCEESRQRIIRMGEQPDTVFNVGDPGVENCLRMELMGRQELAQNLGFSRVKDDYCVVTFHPVTMEEGTALTQINALIDAMDSLQGMAYIITLANADAGGRLINDVWCREGKKRPHWMVVPSLGVQRYLSAVKYCRAVIGNSSSGVVEAPAMGVPTVNIGDRQKGRMMADSVVCCLPIKEEIEKAMKRALAPDFCVEATGISSPFGDGTASEQMLFHIKEFLKQNRKDNKKAFYDFKG